MYIYVQAVCVFGKNIPSLQLPAYPFSSRRYLCSRPCTWWRSPWARGWSAGFSAAEARDWSASSCSDPEGWPWPHTWPRVRTGWTCQNKIPHSCPGTTRWQQRTRQLHSPVSVWFFFFFFFVFFQCRCFKREQKWRHIELIRVAATWHW